MLLILINLITAAFTAPIIPNYGAMGLSFSEGGRAIITGSSAIRINPASTYMPDVEENAIHIVSGPHYATLSGSSNINENFNLFIGLNDMDSKLSLGSTDLYLSYANELNDWVSAGIAVGYTYSTVIRGLDTDIAFNLGAIKHNNGFVSSVVARNLWQKSGYRELGISFGYSFMSKVYTAMDHVMLIVQNRPRYDIVFASLFWITESFSFRGSFRFLDVSTVNLDTSFGLGLGYHSDSFRIDIGVNGNNFSRLIYGVSLVRGTM